MTKMNGSNNTEFKKKLAHTRQKLKTAPKCSLLSDEWQDTLLSQKSRTCPGAGQ
jgi:hypothetical protein